MIGGLMFGTRDEAGEQPSKPVAFHLSFWAARPANILSRVGLLCQLPLFLKRHRSTPGHSIAAARAP